MSYSRKIRGIKLVYEDLGTGMPVVLIHGQPFNRSMWKYQVNELVDSYRLVIPDLRGYGESEVSEGMVLLDELALDIGELLDELKISDAIIMGLSMGGQIALEFFKLFPDRVRGLILADTDSRAEDEGGYQRRIMLSRQIERDGMQKFTDERIHHFISEHTIQHEPEVVAHLREMMESTSAKGASLVQRGRAERKDLTPKLGLIKVPTLVLVGEHDEFTPISTARFIHERIKKSRFNIIKDAGHIPNMEQPEQFNKVLKSFLQENFEAGQKWTFEL